MAIIYLERESVHWSKKEVDIESIEAWWYITEMGIESGFSIGACLVLKVSIEGKVKKGRQWVT